MMMVRLELEVFIARFRPLRGLSRSATNLDEASMRRRFVVTHSEIKESGLAL
jgi:hypothetical protein